MRAWQILASAEKRAVHLLMAIAVAIVPVMALAITFEVVVRYLFLAPTIWVVDASAFALLWMVFLAMPWLIRHRGHIRIEFLTMRLSPRAHAALETVTSLAGTAIMVVILWQTLSETIQAYLRDTHTIGSWEIPRFLVWMVMPIGSAFAVLEFARAAWIRSAPLRRVAPAAPPPTPGDDPIATAIG